MLQEFITFFSGHFYIPLYFLAFIVATIKYRQYFDTPLKYYPILIAYTFFNELLGYLVRNNPNISFFSDIQYSAYNDIIYNIFSVIFFAFFFKVYWQLIKSKTYQKWIIYSAIITGLTFFASCFFQNPFDTNLYYATAVGSWSLIFCVGLYFYDRSNNGKKLVQTRNLMSWISSGLLVFYFLFPILYLIGYLDYYTWEKYSLRTVLKILIIVMYGLIIIGFVKGKRRAFE
ncbi:hypothetical protein MTsPCn5_28180 [Croceitalea sp. MTPC5]|nr:hypothetical protein MTsPCn5_28180 [Croceitalea sp. MTPC5]